jgi:hypothetical protein
LHQREIEWIKDHALAFAKTLYGKHPTQEEISDARARLTQQALRQVDKGWSLKLGSKTDKDAKAFLDQNNAHLFSVKNTYEFVDGSTDGQREISSYSDDEFEALSIFYLSNVHRATSTNPDGTHRNANEAWANEKGIIDAIKDGKIGKDEINQAIRDFVPNALSGIIEIPDTINGAGNFLDAALPTTNQERLDTLYASHTDGSVLQANMATSDVVSTATMATGAGGAFRSGIRGFGKAAEDAVDIPKIDPLDETVESLDDKPIKTITIDYNRHPESAQHIDEAISNGHPDILTINRSKAKENRSKSLHGIKTIKGKDRDEYPPAMFEEGGESASVKHINSSDNRGSGSCIGRQCQDLNDGDKVLMETKGR